MIVITESCNLAIGFVRNDFNKKTEPLPVYPCNWLLLAYFLNRTLTENLQILVIRYSGDMVYHMANVLRTILTCRRNWGGPWRLFATFHVTEIVIYIITPF